MDRKTLYHKTSKGQIQVWTIWTEGDTIFTEHGKEGGKMQISSKKATQKNIGKTNETTATEQADLEAQAMFTFKRDRKYFDTRDQAQNEALASPMLAHSYEKYGKNIIKDCLNFLFVQPKLDGVRCLASRVGDEIALMSRGGKEFDIPHIKRDLLEILPEGVIFDGEIYCHGMDFQTLSGAVKKVQESTNQLQFWVYDIADEVECFEYRKLELSKLMFNPDSSVKICPTETIESESTWGYVKSELDSQLAAAHDKWADQGFEGIIIRTPRLGYKFGYRSQELLKYKVFEDAEFEILDVVPGVGKFENCGIFVCRSDTDPRATFNVTPKRTQAEKEQILLDKADYVGKMLTVTFFGRSNTGIPRFPIGKVIRDYE